MPDVYAITDGEFIKIGMTSSTEARLAALQTANPRRLRTVDALHLESRGECMKMERFLHGFFSRHRSAGEWFSISAQDVEGLFREIRQIGMEEFCLRTDTATPDSRLIEAARRSFGTRMAFGGHRFLFQIQRSRRYDWLTFDLEEGDSLTEEAADALVSGYVNYVRGVVGARSFIVPNCRSYISFSRILKRHTDIWAGRVLGMLKNENNFHHEDMDNPQDPCRHHFVATSVDPERGVETFVCEDCGYTMMAPAGTPPLRQ